MPALYPGIVFFLLRRYLESLGSCRNFVHMFLSICHPKTATYLHIPTTMAKHSDRVYVFYCFPYRSYKDVSWRFEPDFFCWWCWLCVHWLYLFNKIFIKAFLYFKILVIVSSRDSGVYTRELEAVQLTIDLFTVWPFVFNLVVSRALSLISRISSCLLWSICSGLLFIAF